MITDYEEDHESRESMLDNRTVDDIPDDCEKCGNEECKAIPFYCGCDFVPIEGSDE